MVASFLSRIQSISCSNVVAVAGFSIILPTSNPFFSNIIIVGSFSILKVSVSCGEGGILHFLVWLSGSDFIFPKIRTSIPVFSDSKSSTGMFVMQSLHHSAEKATIKYPSASSLIRLEVSSCNMYVCFRSCHFSINLGLILLTYSSAEIVLSLMRARSAFILIKLSENGQVIYPSIRVWRENSPFTYWCG